jgi:hypothetical protein
MPMPGLFPFPEIHTAMTCTWIRSQRQSGPFFGRWKIIRRINKGDEKDTVLTIVQCNSVSFDVVQCKKTGQTK